MLGIDVEKIVKTIVGSIDYAAIAKQVQIDYKEVTGRIDRLICSVDKLADSIDTLISVTKSKKGK